MDSIDQEILNILKEDGRASHTDIAEEIGVSEGTIRNRIEKMKAEDVIEKFTVHVKNQGISAIILVELSTDADIEYFFDQLSEDMRVFEVTGEHDIIIHLSRDTSEELNDELDKIRKIEGVKNTVTKSVLKDRSL
jgi:DNA-binding Lrp family transcriptional regulator